MRAVDADALKRRAQKIATEAWKMKIEAKVETILNQFIDWINEAPTIQAEPHWIPVTERLPENNNPVNVTWVNRNPEVYYMDIKDKPFTATAHYYKGHWYWYSSVTQDFLDEYGKCESELVDKDVEITAWMPLPEEYRGE